MLRMLRTRRMTKRGKEKQAGQRDARAGKNGRSSNPSGGASQPSARPNRNAKVRGKRWRSLWISVPNLDFNDYLLLNRNSSNPSPEICFRNFVTRVLLLRSSSSRSIQTFRLECSRKYHASHLNSWISSAIEAGVRELDLSYSNYSDNISDLPRSLLSYEKFEVLKLGSYFHFHIPDSICLPNLRVLHLISLHLHKGSALAKLISSCPLLEELEIERSSSCDSIRNLVINSCSLKSLKIVADLDDNLRNYVVDAPNLEFVDLCHNLAASYVVKSQLPFMVKANIDVEQFESDCYAPSPRQYDPSHQQNLVELLKAVSNVRYLALSESTMKCLDQQRLDNLPIFHNLKHLVVEKFEKSWLVLSAVLECVPNLITFVLKMANKFILNQYEWHPPRKFSMLHLEKIELVEFEGSSSEMDLVSYFLKNATVLKKMTIRCSSSSDKFVSCIVKKLLMFPRGSTTCQIEFI